jgi:cytoskeleton protein RodZ
VDTSAAETLKRIAQQLVQARETKGISLEEIATKTFIPMRILKALEAGETFKLPEPIFVQGFIKRYAKLVDLDAEALAKQIPLDAPPVAVQLIKEAPRPPLADVVNKRVSLESQPAVKPPLEFVQSARSDGPGSSTSVAGSSVADRDVADRDVAKHYDSGSDFKSNSKNEWNWVWPAITGAVLGFGFLVGAIALLKGTQKAENPQPTPSTAPSLAVKPATTTTASTSPKPSPIVSTSPVASPTASPSPTTSPSSPTATGPVIVGVNLTDASWIEVIVDGEVKFEGNLEKGAKQSWSGKKEVSISSGNAGAVMVTHNQSPLKALGGAGQVETKKFSAAKN